jgi:hypothetical protein
MADKAQMEIFENYFYDMKMAYLKPKNDSVHSDELEILSEKLQVFKAVGVTAVTTANDSSATNVISMNVLSTPVYRLNTITYSYTKPDTTVHSSNMVELTKKESQYAESNPLTKATKSRPTFVRQGGRSIMMFPMPSAEDALLFDYWRKPTVPRWAYVVVNGKALYNYSDSANFELHASEEENLVTRILALSGIIIGNQALLQVAMAEKASTKQDQND